MKKRRKYSEEQIQWIREHNHLTAHEILEANNAIPGFVKIDKTTVIYTLCKREGIEIKKVFNTNPKDRSYKKKTHDRANFSKTYFDGDPMVQLAVLIIEQAKMDYIYALKREDERMIKDVERFIRSQYFQLIAMAEDYIDPDDVIANWRREEKLYEFKTTGRKKEMVC